MNKGSSEGDLTGGNVTNIPIKQGNSGAIPEQDLMRKNYRILSEAEQTHMSQVKTMGESFVKLLHVVGGSDPTSGRLASRELSLAQTKIEEAVMWAVKHITA